jgi:Big-like domain-containing protein
MRAPLPPHNDRASRSLRAGRLSRRCRLGVVLPLLLATACSKKETPTQPEVKLPPEVVSVEPQPRASGVWYDTAIWAQFAEPLDSTTVTSRTVLLKQDTQRLSARIDYDATLQRVVVRPQVPLPLDRTLTVELGPGLRTLDGGQFGQTYFWQFKTNGLRRVELVGPSDRSPFESPAAALLWTPTEAAAGIIRYQLYVSTDSSQVASRAFVPLAATRPFYLPTTKWPQGARMFWSVRAQNQTTGESLDGPTWSFDTAPVGTEIDSMEVPISWWGILNKRTNVRTCGPVTMSTVSSDYISALRWQLEVAPRDVKLASVRMYAQSTTTVAVARSPALQPTQADMPACEIQQPGPPFPDYTLPTITAGGEGTNPVFLHWETDFFTAHVQAAITYGGFYGYVMTSNGNVTYILPRLMLIMYRVPPSLAARPTAR